MPPILGKQENDDVPIVAAGMQVKSESFLRSKKSYFSVPGTETLPAARLKCRQFFEI
jgi:hypothetical protein